jgi:para-aminobenzoate synthetase component 1
MPQGAGAHLLEAGETGGWGSGIGTLAGGASRLAVEPAAVFRGGPEALEAALDWLEPFRDGPADAALLVGWLAYDLGRSFETLPAAPPDEVPLAPVHLAAFRAHYRYDAASASGRVVGSDAGAVRSLAARIAEWSHRPPPPPAAPLPTPRARTSDAGFLAAVRRAQRYIRAGDVYQVNLSRRLDCAPVAAEGLPAQYDALAARAPAPFAAYLETADAAVLCNSPERFLRVAGGRVETCPIKGTRPRGRSEEEDLWLAKELVHSEKDRAEHVMIVDLERNDLGRVCRTGSVRVGELAALRSYATVHHLVSRIQGRLERPRDRVGLLRATFPGGSVTGAPKIRAMQIIDELEPARRGLYTGAIGYFDSAGDLDLAIAIRTAFATRGQLHLQLGGGIVADSDAEGELAETRSKGVAFGWEPC